ncbi:MAG TPA: HAD-IIIC family phosphatase, partial [Candidatus Xenobia bacterium]
GYCAIATAIARRLSKLLGPTLKVVMVDADYTLWQGACGEDGPSRVVLSDACLALQRRLSDLQQAGVAIAVCSKNDEADVRAVFERTDMVFKPHQVAAWCVNWQPKPDNVRRLLGSLNVGADAAVFLDDDAIEVTGMRAAHPAIASVHVTPALARAVDALWLLDRPFGAGAAWRTQAYQEQSARQQARQETLSLEDFVASLQLDVRTAPLAPFQVDRVVELSRRTNQFNLAPRPLTSADLSNGQWLTTHVRDRFGDYGLVGVLGYHLDGAVLTVDTWLLSCRALQRGVEHRMVRHLAGQARERGCSSLLFAFQSSGRNRACEAFLQSLCGEGLELPLAQALTVQYRPQEPAPVAAVSVPPLTSPETWSRVAVELGTMSQVVGAMKRSLQQRPLSDSPAPPKTATEGEVIQLYRDVLRIDEVGLHDGFWELGGFSLLAIQMLTAIERDWGVHLPSTLIFEGKLAPFDVARAVDKARLAAAPAADVAHVLEQISHLSDDEVASLLGRTT